MCRRNMFFQVYIYIYIYICIIVNILCKGYNKYSKYNHDNNNLRKAECEDGRLMEVTNAPVVISRSLYHRVCYVLQSIICCLS